MRCTRARIEMVCSLAGVELVRETPSAFPAEVYPRQLVVSPWVGMHYADEYSGRGPNDARVPPRLNSVHGRYV